KNFNCEPLTITNYHWLIMIIPTNHIVVLLIIDSWAKLKYPHPFFPRLVRNQESPSFLPYIPVNTASAIILTLGSCRAYLFWLFPAQAVWLTVVVCPWD